MGYTGPCENSIDAVASRDHVAEFLFVGDLALAGEIRLGSDQDALDVIPDKVNEFAIELGSREWMKLAD